ncbi:sulfatase-like hydrolase/transferase [Tichowtungia aerotolerans]|uniref:Sulfatase-like hydrolase/transferase n=1 Tax=Tichowtungia aerotolerans TaxID=2697043 RepID=A0A6P1MAU7_9BACT|nr:sulfatase-like hydrolase/transferase [Tichowtungia aerotolerans]QHI68686.1 sulfatase-like hydrolase/transferase [Tichowtungia aerotolerans]
MKSKLLLFLFSSAVALGATKPNIVFVLADDVSAKDLRCYNEHGIKLPTIEKMAEEGVMFQTAWAAPVCGPSRAILQTGKYPFKQGYFENHVEPNIRLWRNPRHQLVGQVLKKAGYVNAWYGKIHFGGTPVNYGFDEYCTTQWWDGYDGPFQSPKKTTAGMYSVSWYWHPGLLENGKGLQTGSEDFGPQIESERILDFITRHKDRPFFVYWPSNLPHMAHQGGTPMNGNWFYPDVPVCDASGKPTGKKEKGTLASNMQFLDRKLELIVGRLDDLGILDNTIIFLAGDNGTPGYGKGKFESEVAPHVPFVVWGPGNVKSRGASPVMVDFSDIMPTLAELCGAEIPDDINGKSFAPYLLGKPFEPREWVFMQFNNARWLRNDRWLLDGYGRFYDCGDERDESTGYGALSQCEPLGANGPKDPDIGYQDVTESYDPEVVAARKRFEAILKDLPGPDYNDPETKAAWQKFRSWNKPVQLYQPDYL